MAVIGPTFFSSPAVVVADPPTIGYDAAAAFASGRGPFALARVDDNNALFSYEDISTNRKRVRIINVTGGVVTFGTAFDLETVGGVGQGLNALSTVDVAAGKFIVFYDNKCRIVTVTAGVISLGVETVIATTATIPSASMGAMTGAAISPTIVAAMLSTGSATGLYVAIGNVSGTTTSWAAPVSTGLDVLPGGRLLTGDGGVVLYGRKLGLVDSRLWSVSVSAAGVATPPYLTATVADRVHTDSTGEAGPSAQISNGLHAHIAKVTVGLDGYYCTRAQVSGGVSTYSNSDANPNLLSLSPYTSPRRPKWGTIATAPSESKLLMVSSDNYGPNFVASRMTVSGNINMSADTLLLGPYVLDTPGAPGFAPGVTFLTENKALVAFQGVSSNIYGILLSL